MGTAEARHSAGEPLARRGEPFDVDCPSPTDMIFTKSVKPWVTPSEKPMKISSPRYSKSLPTGIRSIVADPDQTYRSKEEIEEYKKSKDPITLFRKKLLDEGVLSEEKAKGIDNKAKEEADAPRILPTPVPTPKFRNLWTMFIGKRQSIAKDIRGNYVLRNRVIIFRRFKKCLKSQRSPQSSLAEEIERDDNVVPMGEEVAQFKGSYKVSEGLLEKFGSEKIIDTPISEAAFSDLRSVRHARYASRCEFRFWSFCYAAFDQIFNNAANGVIAGGLSQCHCLSRTRKWWHKRGGHPLTYPRKFCRQHPWAQGNLPLHPS